jgi:hypothetical protein
MIRTSRHLNKFADAWATRMSGWDRPHTIFLGCDMSDSAHTMPIAGQNLRASDD